MRTDVRPFRNPFLGLLLVAPQLLITFIFFIWPTLVAMKMAFLQGDAFGIQAYFVGLDNFKSLWRDPSYLQAFGVTVIFSLAVAVCALLSGLLLAVLVHNVGRGSHFYKTLLIWPYAVAPAVAGLLWRFLFNPSVGVLTSVMHYFGYEWNYLLNGKQALLLVVVAATWQQFSYNFLFFLVGLHAIPKSLLEAAAIDGAGPLRRFWHIVFPLLSPTTFFLLVINLIYAFFDTFGVIQVVTQGGPANMTNTLVYKVYNDGFLGLNLGGSAAQSLVLMMIVIVLTFIQFRYIERKVHY